METGFIYFGARYYDARLGRWLSADDRFDGFYTIQGMNIYTYVRSNPIVYHDPTGNNTAVLQATKGAGGAGHTGNLTQNENGKWEYYSVNGSDPTSNAGSQGKQYKFDSIEDFKKHQENLANERKRVGEESFEALKETDPKSYQKMKEFTRKGGHVRYDKILEIETTTEQDEIILEHLKSNISIWEYRLTGNDNKLANRAAKGLMYWSSGTGFIPGFFIGGYILGKDSNNCKDLVRDAFEKSGIKTKQFTFPNDWYDHIRDTSIDGAYGHEK